MSFSNFTMYFAMDEKDYAGNRSLYMVSRRSYRNDPKFSDRQVWTNSADPDQTAPTAA